MCGTDNRDHLVKLCLDPPKRGIIGVGNAPCQPLSHKPPGCQKRVQWPWQGLEMLDKGHEPSPSPPLGRLERPRRTQQINQVSARIICIQWIIVVVYSNPQSRLDYGLKYTSREFLEIHSMLFNITIVYCPELIPSQSRCSFLPELFLGPPGIPRSLSL